MRLDRDHMLVRLLALVAVSALLLAACGEDTEPDPAPAASPGGDGAIETVEDLGEGHTVAVQDGTTGETYAQENLAEGVEVRAFPEGPDGYTALEACQVDAVINDLGTAESEVPEREGLEIAQKIDTGEVYGIAVDPAKEPLLDAINEALAQMVEDGTYDEIYAKYPKLGDFGNVTGSFDLAPSGEIPEFTTATEGVLLVGSDVPYPPYEYREDGELTGFDIDLMNEIASRLGVTAEYKDTDFDTIFTQLAAGRYDAVVAASSITEEREEEVNFSEGYFRSQGSLTVNPTCS